MIGDSWFNFKDELEMKAETDLYCPGCGDKIWNKGDVLRSLFFTRSEEKCCNCDTVLRRRTPGGQSDPFNFNTTKVTEREYVREWYFCQLKSDEELKNYDCKDPDGYPDCRTCDYQKKINAETERVAEECREWNRKHGGVRPLESSTKGVHDGVN